MIKLSLADMLVVEDSTAKVPTFDSESLLMFDTRSVAEGTLLSNAEVWDITPESVALCESDASSNANAVALLVTEALAVTV